MTSRDGYLKIANNNPDFEGIVSDVVYESDTFRKTPDGVEHQYGVKNRGKLVGAYALVYRKGIRFPVYVFAPFNDYNKGNDIWRTYPHAMILKVAESMALKRTFSLSGLVSREELDIEETDKAPTQSADASMPQQQRGQPRHSQPADPIGEAAKALYQSYLNLFNGNVNHAVNAMKKATGKGSSKDFTMEDIEALRLDLQRRETEITDAAGLYDENKDFFNPDEIGVEEAS
jgi:hypothetical protein